MNRYLVLLLVLSIFGCISTYSDEKQKDIDWCKGLQEYGNSKICFDKENLYCDSISPQRSCLLYLAVTKYNDSKICDEIPEGPLLGWAGSESHWVIEGAANRTTCINYFENGVDKK